MEKLNIEEQIALEPVAVSVVLPFYNAHTYLKEAIEGILAQSFDSFELILVDDGSTDRSLDIAKSFKELDRRVRIITENNAGPAAARNKGLVRARGDYIIFLDADDFYEPTLISSLYSLAVEKNIDVAIADFDVYNTRRGTFEHNVESDHYHLLAGGNVVSKSEHPDHILQCATGYVWNKLFRRDFIFENKLSFNTDLKIFEDVCFVTAAVACASRIAKCEDILVHHRVYSEQSRPKMFKKHYHDVPLVYSEIKKFLMHRGIYAPISSSFMNLSASRCYNIYNILWKDAKESFWNLLHEEYAELLDWTSADPDEVERPVVRSFIAAVSMYSHKQYVKKRKTMAVVEDVGMDQKFERKKALKRFCGIFRFGKR